MWHMCMHVCVLESMYACVCMSLPVCVLKSMYACVCMCLYACACVHVYRPENIGYLHQLFSTHVFEFLIKPGAHRMARTVDGTQGMTLEVFRPANTHA